MLVLAEVLPARTACAHDAPAIAPTRLDFDAASAPKTCNDAKTFSTLLGNWVGQETLTPDAERQLVVRIRRSPAGGKLVDVTLVGTDGTALAEEQMTFAGTTECHKVLWEAARVGARQLGAFDEPPPPESVPTYSAPLPPEPCPTCPACSTCPAPALPPPRLALVPPTHGVSIGVGIFFGMGTPGNTIGPQVAFGFRPAVHTPHLQLELHGAFTQTLPNASEAFRLKMVPLGGLICYAPTALRLCSGLTTTFSSAEHPNIDSGNDALRISLAANMRVGAEFEIVGPFSIRLDAFALFPLWDRTFGHALPSLEHLTPLTAGASAMGVWSFK
jgi:hypothetical protein